MKNNLLEVEGLTVTFKHRDRQLIQSVSNVSFTIARGETLGLVGESGCGKSALARAVMQLPKPLSGRVLLNGSGLTQSGQSQSHQSQVDLTQLGKKRLRRLRPRFQMVFQDSISSLNPRRSIIDTLTVPLKVIGITDRKERRRRALEMLVSVGIDPQFRRYKPYQLSGGQCQRIQIARALMPGPELLICDEPVSSLDVSVQAQIINLLERLRKKHGLTMLFISHDLAVVKNVCDRVMVMYLGKLCEQAPCEKLYKTHYHPYTRALLSAIPNPDPHLPPRQPDITTGEMPTPAKPLSGCRFSTRCPRAKKRCVQEEPVFREIEPSHCVACHFPME